MSKRADRFSSGKRPNSKRKVKTVNSPNGPAPSFEVIMERNDETTIGDAHASFLGEGLVQVYTREELTVDMDVRLIKRSAKPNKERCWLCTVIDVLKQGLNKNEYLLQEQEE